MTLLRIRSLAVLSLGAAGLVAFAAGGQAEQRLSKDVGPVNSACDSLEKGSGAWASCVGVARAGMPENELFYAGYWLAKSGKYEEALGYLALASKADERVETYIGYATRKLGNVDAALPHYARALEINPNYTVARAYLAEAHLSRGNADLAKAELREIGARCGATCAEYQDLERQITAFERGAARG